MKYAWKLPCILESFEAASAEVSPTTSLFLAMSIQHRQNIHRKLDHDHFEVMFASTSLFGVL
jgi:hypothetical protein